jgi:hypothetical protein
MPRSKCERQDDMGVLSGVLKSQLCNLIDETGSISAAGWPCPPKCLTRSMINSAVAAVPSERTVNSMVASRR